MGEDEKLARLFVTTDLSNLARRLHERGIRPDFFGRDDVIEDDQHSFIGLIIGKRGNLTGPKAEGAAKDWKLVRSQAPRSIIHVSIAGYDQDLRKLWELAEVRRFVRRWARAAGLGDPYVAMREIGNGDQFPNLLVLLAKCGTFGKDYPFEVTIKERAVAPRRPMPAPGNVASAYRDQEKVILVTKDFMLNQLRRDASRIAGSFDEHVGSELEKISELVANIYGILAPKIIGTNLTEKDLTSTSARLLHHAGTTFIGAAHLARGGFRRQYMVLLRSVIETIAVVLQLCADPKALVHFYAGTLSSTKAVTAANKRFPFPVFGRLYGMLSNEFVHISENHAAFEPMGDYSKDDEDLKLILTSVKFTALVMYIATELVFIEFIPRPRYWKIVARHEDGTRVEVSYEPSEEARGWQAEFLGANTSD